MATIRVFKDILKQQPLVHETEGEINLLDWLIESDYGHIGEHGAIVKLNGIIIADSSKHDDMDERIDIKVGLFDSVDVVTVPKGVDPVTLAYAVVASIVAAGIAIALAPEPNIPNDAGKRSSSPNNQLNAATNAFRPREAIPDISGQVVSYPDFVQSSYYIYEENLKKFVEVFCIGVGYHDVQEIKDGENLFSATQGSTATVYQPSDTLPDLADVRASNSVDGQEIIPTDDPSRQFSGDLSFQNSGLTLIADGDVVLSLSLESGDSVLVNFDGTDGEGTPVNFSETRTIDEILTDSSFTVTSAFPVTTESGTTGTGTVSIPSSVPVAPWFTTEGSDTTEVRFHLNAPQGIRSDTNEFLKINITLRVEEIDANGDPTGSNQATKAVFIGGNTLNPQFRTFYIQGLTPSRYRARALRTTNAQPDGAIDLVKFERLESVRYYTPAFGNVTTLITNRRATTQPTSGRQSKTNALVTRELPIFDPNTGTFGARAATRSFAQYVMYVLNEQAGVPLDDIAYQELFDIEDSLSSAELGYFDFTFDSEDISAKQRVESACNVARVKVYQLGNVWRFVREEAKQARQAFFGRRNLTPASSQWTGETFRDDDFDSYELEYVDPDTNSEAFVRRRINPTTGAIETGLGNRPKRKPLAGCRNLVQATNRCELEIGRLRYQRKTIRDVALMDALNVGVGERIGYADINDADVFDGEILAQDGNVFTTSEKFTPESGKTYYVYITDEDGTISNSVIATARSDGNEFGFEASGLTAYTADGVNAQLGSMYFIAADGDETNDYILTSRGRPNERGECEIVGSNYDERMFAQD